MSNIGKRAFVFIKLSGFHVLSPPGATLTYNAPAARSLKDVARYHKAVKQLVLEASPDLSCVNIMCEKVGEVCICVCALGCCENHSPPLVHFTTRHNLMPPTALHLQTGRLIEFCAKC